MAQESIALGDTVTWTSQAHGTALSKSGVVVAIVPPGERPDRDAFPTLYKHAGCGFGRKRESYVVRVGRSRIFWPREGLLKKARPE